jgi:hypothetical protein
MAEYEKQVRKILTRHGCTFIRHGKGDHDIWYSPITKLPITVDGEMKIPRSMGISSLDRKFIILAGVHTPSEDVKTQF